MSDLAAWLPDRIAEDEAAARAYLPYAAARRLDQWFERFIADCDARRRIVAEHRPWTGKQQGNGVYCSTCVGYPIRSRDHIGVAWPCPTLRLLALPYAGQPGWREEWRP